MDLTDPATFAEAYSEHAKSVYLVALRVVKDPVRAQDITQDVFLRLWRRPGSFNADRGDLGAYLRMLSRSRALDQWREAQSAGRAGDRLKTAAAREPATRPADRPDLAAERAGDNATLHCAVRALPDPQREAVVLAYWGGLTAEQIARHVGVPVGTAKSRLRLGIGKLRGAVAVAAAH